MAPRGTLLALAVAAGAAACVGTEPLRVDAPVAGEGTTIVQRGVTVSAWAWPSAPARAGQDATLAVDVRIENDSGRTLRIDTRGVALARQALDPRDDAPTDDGALVAEAEPRFAAMQPPIPTRVRRALAPPSADQGGGVWPGPFADPDVLRPAPRTPRDPERWDRVPLTDRILVDGAAAEGFVFFAGVPPVFAELDLVVPLVDVDGASLGEARLPLSFGASSR